MTDTDDDRTREHRRADYRKVLSTIRHNTGGRQRVLVPSRALYTTLVANGSMAHDIARSSIQAAVENEDVLRRTDTDGEFEYALYPDGVEEITADHPYRKQNADAFRSIIEAEIDRDDTDRDVIGWANEWIAELEGEA
jgi:hypothetical protein